MIPELISWVLHVPVLFKSSIHQILQRLSRHTRWDADVSETESWIIDAESDTSCVACIESTRGHGARKDVFDGELDRLVDD
jgi:hypothetical protein